MTREDIDRLFALLEVYRPGDRHLEDRRLRAAWLLVLEPYEPAEIKQAVGAYFRESKYWPDPSDIATRCPRVVERAPCGAGSGRCSAREAARISGQLEELLELGALMALDYQAAGVPHPAAARAQGWSCRTWMERCREAVG